MELQLDCQPLKADTPQPLNPFQGLYRSQSFLYHKAESRKFNTTDDLSLLKLILNLSARPVSKAAEEREELTIQEEMPEELFKQSLKFVPLEQFENFRCLRET